MLELKNVCAGYGGEDKLHNVSLKIERGRIYAVVGKNGCGKSTLLKACAGILKANAGEILLEGKRLDQWDDRMRAMKMSYLPQMRSAPGISAGRMVEHGCYPRLGKPRKLKDSDREIVRQAMERMDIAQLGAKSMKELSGGECQRVYMAMQLAQDADLMLLDEPTTYMDIEYQLLLMKILQELRDAGKSIIMVLHDLQQALKIADEMIAMDAGRIEKTGCSEEMLASGVLERIFNVRIRVDGEGIIYERNHRPE